METTFNYICDGFQVIYFEVGFNFALGTPFHALKQMVITFLSLSGLNASLPRYGKRGVILTPEAPLTLYSESSKLFKLISLINQ